MNRRKFLKLLTGLPLFTLGERASAKSREFLLLETNVAGYRYYEGDKLRQLLTPGDPLELRREPWNVHDEKAVALYWRNRKLGYIPRVDNAVIANLLDQGRVLHTYIQEKRQTRNPWERLWVRVEMKV